MSGITGAFFQVDRDFSLVSPLMTVLETQNLQGFVFQTNVQLIRTFEGDFIAAYRTDTQGGIGEWGASIIKTDPQGNEIWRWEDADDNLVAFISTSDGGVAALMGTFQGMKLVKLDRNGNLN